MSVSHFELVLVLPVSDLAVDAIGMLGKPQPGLRERDPKRFVVLVAVCTCLSQAVFGIGAILLDGSHDPAPPDACYAFQSSPADKGENAERFRYLWAIHPLYDIERKEQAGATGYCLSEA